MPLLTLPHELVERILLLATESVQTCRLVNRILNEIIQSSALLQYIQACEAPGAIDNPQSPLSYPERLEELQKREYAWRKLKPVFETTIKVNHQPSLLYGLTEGAYFLGDNNKKDLHYCQLPSSTQDDPRWIRIQGHGTEESLPGNFINFATAIYEHDLIVKASSSRVVNQADAVRHYSLDLVLLKFSTGEYHPLARQPRIHVQISLEPLPWVSPGIVGDNLTLVVHSEEPGNGTYGVDRLFIFDWKTGHKRLEHEGSDLPYLEFAFISPELLLVPNLIHAHFEVWHIPPNPKPPVQILCLKIPHISSCYSLVNISCDGEPNPFLHTMPYFPPRPFIPSPESSIIIANVDLSSGPDSSFTRVQDASFTLIMHRRALLDMIQKWTSPSVELLQQEDIGLWFTNELSVETVADPDDDESVTKLVAYSRVVAINPHHPPRTLRSPGSSSISVGTCTTFDSSPTEYYIPQIKWEDWGPPISRWFQVSESQVRWTVNSVGQRYAFSDSNGGKLTVSVADFNPHNVRRHEEITKRSRGEDEDNGRNGNNEDGEDQDFKTLDHKGVFSEVVYMGLKCVVYRTPDEYDFDAVLMDGERLLGLKLNREGKHKCVKVLYFG